jgi:hypothetical protein
MDYKAKYLKYKNKYLNLQKGGLCITQECKLKEELNKAGFKDYFIDDIIKYKYTDNIKMAYEMLKAGFSHDNVFYYFLAWRDKLNEAQLKTAIYLLKTVKFEQKEAILLSLLYNGEINEQQIKTANSMKEKYDVHMAYKIALGLTDLQIIQFNNFINNGFEVDAAYEGAKLNDAQIKNAIGIKTSNYSYRFSDLCIIIFAKKYEGDFNNGQFKEIYDYVTKNEMPSSSPHMNYLNDACNLTYEEFHKKYINRGRDPLYSAYGPRSHR